MARARPRKLLPRLLFVALLCGLTGVVGASLFVDHQGSARIVARAEAPGAPVALVFGAGLVAVDHPSPVLAERLDAAIDLYRRGTVRRLLLSGDNSDRSHDETRAMRRYVIDRGIPAVDAVGDFAGLSTYDTCYRAQAIFGVQRAILVTQRFHLPRALYIARGLGMDAWGVAADEGRNPVPSYLLREFLSRALAFAMVVLRPEPRILGQPLPVLSTPAP